MKIEVCLSARQAKAVTAAAAATRMQPAEALRTAAIATLTMLWDPDELRVHLIDVARDTRRGRMPQAVTL